MCVCARIYVSLHVISLALVRCSVHRVHLCLWGALELALHSVMSHFSGEGPVPHVQRHGIT